MSLAEIVRILDGSLPPGDYAGMAQRLNASNAEHVDEVKDSRQTYLDEIAGGLELFAGFAADIIEGQMKANGLILDSTASARSEREHAVSANEQPTPS